MKVDFKKNTQVMEMIHAAPYFKKNEKTFFRKAKPEELGSTLITYVKDPHSEGFRKEAEITIDGKRVIARNNIILGYCGNNNPIHNQWTKPMSEVVESYGQECLDSLSTEYQEYSQIKPIKLLKLTPDVMNILGRTGENELLIDVAWSDKPMVALVGDYLAANGYSISQVDIQTQYQEIKQ